VANQLGKRFECAVCGTETLCTKAGSGVVHCCGQEMQLKEPKPLPSAD
jgi:transcription elongation factor Elf1